MHVRSMQSRSPSGRRVARRSKLAALAAFATFGVATEVARGSEPSTADAGADPRVGMGVGPWTPSDPAIADAWSADPAARQSTPPDDSGWTDNTRKWLSGWSIDASAWTINPPHDDAYGAGTVKLDREQLHLEGRWNYEDLHTGSVWAGWNFDWRSRPEDGVELTVTPMAGVVFGDTDGLAPGVELDVTWWWLEFYNESEYLFDAHDRDDDYFYSWSELTVSCLLYTSDAADE